jgi:rSAM/selenodomain-associated transferase 2/rSAM/selenodomain-associated transferase 1
LRRRAGLDPARTSPFGAPFRGGIADPHAGDERRPHPPSLRISIVVPALDEARAIVATLVALQPFRAAGHELIVVDGSSVDATVALATPLADRVVGAPRGRALQMNAGAALAVGEVLLFLHADSRLPAEAIAALVGELPRSGRRWGRFDIAIAGRAGLLRVVEALMNLRSRATGIATGDQAIFVERALFREVGGYPEQPLMEDIELSRRLKRAAGAPLCLRQRVVTSARRWERDGPWRTVVAMWRWRLAYWRGASPADLAADYGTRRGSPPVTLQVFAKNPVPGHVKTRLANAIGTAEAAAHYTRFVERTLASAVAAREGGIVDRVELWCAPHADAPVFAAWRDRFDVALESQTGLDVGARMRNALHAALAGGSRAILIGTDCPALDLSYLAQAVAALDDHAAVFGPAEDGGYVLVGLARAIDAFSGIPWSAAETMAATRGKLRAQRVRWQELPTLWDVDTPDDLARWQTLSASTAPASPPQSGSRPRA